MITRWLVFLVFFVPAAAHAEAAAAPSLDPANWVAVATELPAHISIEEVAALPATVFGAYEPGRTVLHRSRGNPIWLRLELPSSGPDGRAALLIPGKGYDDFVDLYLPTEEGGWRRLRGGEASSPSERSWLGLQTAFAVQLPPKGRRTTAFLRIDEAINPEWTLRLETDVAGYVAREHRRATLLFVYFGGLGAIFLYNVFLFVRLRYRDLLYYLLYLGAFGTMLAIESNALGLFVPLGDPIRVTGILALFDLSVAALLAFVREYHELRRLAPRLAKVLAWAAWVFVAVANVYWLSIAEGIGATLFSCNALLTFAGVAAAPITAAYAWRRGAHQARFFLVAFGCYALAMGVVIVNDQLGTFLSPVGEDAVALSGSAAEFILLSFAIGDRFRRIREEKEALQASYTARLERDVAARTAELARLNAEKDELMGVVAHDLRAPLGALRGTARLVRASPTLTSPDDREAIDDISDAADRMLRLAGTLLDRHVAERGQVPVQLVTADVRSVLAETAKRFRESAAAKRQTLVFAPGETAFAASHDPSLLAQVLDNFVSNALKFSPAGAEIRLNVARASDGAVRLAVHDAGPGLSEADLVKVFQPFARLDARPTAGEDSVGFGLAAARKLTLAMGGRIGTENASEGGAVFWVEFPRLQPRE